MRQSRKQKQEDNRNVLGQDETVLVEPVYQFHGCADVNLKRASVYPKIAVTATSGTVGCAGDHGGGNLCTAFDWRVYDGRHAPC